VEVEIDRGLWRTRPPAFAPDPIPIGAAALRRTGMTALPAAAGRLVGACTFVVVPAREVLRAPVARPNAKKQANTAHTEATAIGTRGSMRARPRPKCIQRLSM
jgi:hypothetical protein